MKSDPILVSPTAKIVVYLRGKSDIPYCRQIAELCDAEDVSRLTFGYDTMMVENRRASTIMRFKALSAAAKAQGATQYFELASGIAPRGLIFSEDPSVTFVEIDLPDIMREKKDIVARLIDFSTRPNYKLYPGDVLNLDELTAAAKEFDPKKPIVVMHEGFMQYLDHSEKEKLASNIRKTLEASGGAWITTDVITRDYFDKHYNVASNSRKILNSLVEKTGRDLVNNCFDSTDDALAFFDKYGFACEEFKQLSFCPEVLETAPNDEVRSRIQNETLWVMRLK